MYCSRKYILVFVFKIHFSAVSVLRDIICMQIVVILIIGLRTPGIFLNLSAVSFSYSVYNIIFSPCFFLLFFVEKLNGILSS